MKRNVWNKCVICGKFIAYQEFVDNIAKNEYISPSSEFSDEKFEAYHIKCERVR